MVAIFIVCWLPLNGINLLLEYREDEVGNWRFILLVFFVGHVVAMSSTVYNPPRRSVSAVSVRSGCAASRGRRTSSGSVYNPFLYAWMNDAFRRQFQRVLPLCCPAGRRSSAAAETAVTTAHGGCTTAMPTATAAAQLADMQALVKSAADDARVRVESNLD